MKTLSLTIDAHVALLTFDQPGATVNTLTHQLLDEFEHVLDQLESDDTIRAVIIRSGKPNQFIAGADINIFPKFRKQGDAVAFSEDLHRLLNRLNVLPIPVIAAIHGPALGGGLEIALACHYRIATDHPSTRFGMPEVTLGLCPGGGGTQRLPALTGVSNALPILLTGEPVYAHDALRIGLVDELIFEQGLLHAANNVAADLLARFNTNSRKPYSRPRSRTSHITEQNPLSRSLIFSREEKKILTATRGLLPAPFAILNCVHYGLKHDINKGLAFEAQTFEQLVMSDESRQLVHGFIARQSTRKNPSAAKPQEVKHIGIIGAGLMGSGITSASIENGFSVTLKDRDFASAIMGKQTTWQALQQRVRNQTLTAAQCDRLISGIRLTDDNRDLARLPLVIEAVYEDISVKRSVLKEVESVISENAIFATNSSSIPIADIAKNALRPERVIGMHYFSPVRKMPLLEIVRGKKTDEEAVATACDVGIRQGKNVIVVGDAPGFYVTRIIMPMINEAMLLLEEGADIRIIDIAMKNFGFPVGPVTLLDEAGIDVVSHINEIIHPIFKKRGIRLPQVIHILHESGYAGRKNRRGFYDYRNRKKLINEEIYTFFGGSARRDFSFETISNRISLVMINEAAHCLQEGIIKQPQDGDTGAVLGMGFPAFRGGPFRYIDQVGAKNIWDRLEYLHNLHGKRFKPATLLSDHIRAKKPFYDV